MLPVLSARACKDVSRSRTALSKSPPARILEEARERDLDASSTVFRRKSNGAVAAVAETFSCSVLFKDICIISNNYFSVSF